MFAVLRFGRFVSGRRALGDEGEIVRVLDQNAAFSG
jgi:hypothetical protein